MRGRWRACPSQGRARHDNKWTRGLDELVLAVAFVRNDQIDVVRIALNGIMQLGGNAECIQTIAEDVAAG